MEGIKDRRGVVLDYGTGLSRVSPGIIKTAMHPLEANQSCLRYIRWDRWEEMSGR